MAQQLGVLIVEDDHATRRSIAAKVDQHPSLKVIGDAALLANGLALLESLNPDVVLVDLELPDGNGDDLIKAATGRCHVMVISVFGDETRVINAIRSGADGYLLKDDDASEITTAILQLVDGGSPISPSIARHLIRTFTNVSATEPAPDIALSERELQVLTLAAKGYTYAEIAGLLEVSSNTIGSYTKRIYNKLMVNSKSQAVYEAQRMGLMKD